MNELGVLATPQMKQKYRNKLDDGADQNAWAQESSLGSDACEWTWWWGQGGEYLPIHWEKLFIREGHSLIYLFFSFIRYPVFLSRADHVRVKGSYLCRLLSVEPLKTVE